MWHITHALALQRVLNLGSYHTAWQWLHKVRRAMVKPGRDRLNGCIEIDETYVGGRMPGKRGREGGGKALVGIAVEDKGDEGIGRIRLLHLENASSISLIPFVQSIAQPPGSGSTIRKDDWISYKPLPSLGFGHVTSLPLLEVAIDLNLDPLDEDYEHSI